MFFVFGGENKMKGKGTPGGPGIIVLIIVVLFVQTCYNTSQVILPVPCTSGFLSFCIKR